MSIRVFFADWSPEFLEICKTLTTEYDWEFCYIHASFKTEELVKTQFPDAIYHSDLDAYRAIPAPECRHLKPALLDLPLLEAMSRYAPDILKTMERMELGSPFSYEDRIHLYHSLLRLWSATLDKVKPDLVFFSEEPHGFVFLTVYGLCQIKGIKTIMLQNSSIPGLVLPVEKYEVGSELLRERYQQKLVNNEYPVTISNRLEQYLTKLRQDYQVAMPGYTRANLAGAQYRRKFLTPRWFIQRLLRFKRYPLYLASLRHMATVDPPLRKQKGRLFEESKRANALKWRLHRVYGEPRKKRRLQEYYDVRCKKVDFTQPYIYVALHDQPERTTLPMGGVFVYQRLMIDMLAQLVPSGWKIIVKEHHMTFNWQAGKKSVDRTPVFYDDVLKNDNVAFAPIQTSTFDLIDNAQAVATITGTVGWEAVVRGKPVLVFGYAWYRDCAGVFFCRSVGECTSALETIAAGYSVNDQHVRLFLQTVGEIYDKGSRNYIVEQSQVDYSAAENAKLLAGAMHRKAQLLLMTHLLDK